MDVKIGVKHSKNPGNHQNKTFPIFVKSTFSSSDEIGDKMCTELLEITLAHLIFKNGPADPLKP